MANRKASSRVVTLPPPVGGWNTRDPLPEMPPKDAIHLTNMIPGVAEVRLRNGSADHATGLLTFVETLMVHSGVDGTEKLFAAVPTKIFNVTTAGAVGAADISSLTNGRWQHTMFGTAAGNYLVAVNGADAGRYYDGTTWASLSITGVASTDLVNVTPHVGRLWFVEKNKLDAWYLDVSAISGAATKLPIGQFCRLGGYLLAMGSWSVDGGSGMNDNAVFITSNGEVVVYQGTDPSSSSTWSLVGVFRIAEPIGRRCVIKAGPDLAIITSAGVLPLSRVLSVNLSAQKSFSFSDKISPSFETAYRVSKDSHGWQIIEWPRANLIVCNIPITERIEQHQYVANVLTGAWAPWEGLNAGCWALMAGTLYYGNNSGTVRKFGSDWLDGTASISFRIQQAYTNFGGSNVKRFLAARPLLTAPASFTPSIAIQVDFNTELLSLPGTSADSQASFWDTSPWDTSDWDETSEPTSIWQAVTGVGQVGSITMTGSMSQGLVLNNTDVQFEVGGYL